MLECVVNISEGRDSDLVAEIAGTAAPYLLDVHSDAEHHRSVLTVIGEQAPRAITAAAVTRLDLRCHEGVHPRIGVVDVVPFVPLGSATLADAEAARDRFAAWATDTLGVPTFSYGSQRSLPEVRREAFKELKPDRGANVAHPTAGAIAVGARPLLVAYNVWLASDDPALARRLARSLRDPTVRTLALAVGRELQVSINLVDPEVTGPAVVYDRIAAETEIARAELVGLVPRNVLDKIDPDRWEELDLAESRTIEARVEACGLMID